MHGDSSEVVIWPSHTPLGTRRRTRRVLLLLQRREHRCRERVIRCTYEKIRSLGENGMPGRKCTSNEPSLPSTAVFLEVRV